MYNTGIDHTREIWFRQQSMDAGFHIKYWYFGVAIILAAEWVYLTGWPWAKAWWMARHADKLAVPAE